MSDGFTIFTTVCGLLGDAAVMFFTIYTFYLTAVSRKLELVSPSFHYSMFYGTKITLTVMNKSLHSIPVEHVFIMKRYEDRFIYIGLEDYDPPLSVDSWKIEKLEMQPFTTIMGWPFKNEEGYPDYNEIAKDSVIGIESGDTIIWIRPYKKAPLKEAKKTYKKKDYDRVTVWRHEQDGAILSPSVDCEITVLLKDLNGQNVLESAFGISTANGGSDLLLDKAILGHNAFPGAGHTADSIRDFLAQAFGISKNRINVLMLRDPIVEAERNKVTQPQVGQSKRKVK